MKKEKAIQFRPWADEGTRAKLDPLETLDEVRALIEKWQDTTLEDLPRVAVDSPDFYDALPCAVSAIYFLGNDRQGLLYIGKATNLKTRWRRDHDAPSLNHAKLEQCLDLGDVELAWWAVPTHCLVILENLLVRLHRPKWNNHVN
jgi:hypothetical protein